jgi:hypothetical protein
MKDSHPHKITKILFLENDLVSYPFMRNRRYFPVLMRKPQKMRKKTGNASLIRGNQAGFPRIHAG